MTDRARYLPDITLPAYSYVPGQFPHPRSDPAGHRFGQDLPAAPIPDPARWADSTHYLLGIDLFNHGYYWEAHELWESLWHACGRRGRLATFFKALIQLAVVGVKVREGRSESAAAHARRARELLDELNVDRLMGVDIAALIAHSDALIASPPVARDTNAPVEVVFAFDLRPQD